ncbi:hypothetical protein ACFYKX_11605 [Cytobacillus sp. FJAT-54145]|uniref:Uncharacterized protein n=1 Tax=Cytobacillus spartinae TaxID=3299023 RepID=A0ABW6KCD7_9BACI
MKKKRRNFRDMEIEVVITSSGDEDAEDLLAPLFLKWINEDAGYEKYEIVDCKENINPSQ